MEIWKACETDYWFYLESMWKHVKGFVMSFKYGRTCLYASFISWHKKTIRHMPASLTSLGRALDTFLLSSVIHSAPWQLDDQSILAKEKKYIKYHRNSQYLLSNIRRYYISNVSTQLIEEWDSALRKIHNRLTEINRYT